MALPDTGVYGRIKRWQQYAKDRNLTPGQAMLMPFGYVPPGSDGSFSGGGGAGPTAVQDLTDQAKAQAAEAAKAAAPADNHGAVLRELARHRTQMMIRNTNGRSGSLLGIGTSSFRSSSGGAASSMSFNGPVAASSTYGLQALRSINSRSRIR
jgi:hypothetical protein